MNAWERWTAGERATVVLFAAGVVAFAGSMAYRHAGQSAPVIHISDPPGISEGKSLPRPPVVLHGNQTASSPDTQPQPEQKTSSSPSAKVDTPALPAKPSAKVDAASADAKPPADAQTQPPAVIDLNVATESDLDRLPGIGPVLAKRIVEYRSTKGRFQTVEELLEVKGIGEKKLAKIRPLVTVQ